MTLALANMRASVQACEDAEKGARCWVQLLSAKNFSAVQKHCHPEKLQPIHQLKLVDTKTKPAKAG